MSKPLVVECDLHFERRDARRLRASTDSWTIPQPGCIPRLARLMALAMHFERLLADGAVKDYRTIARFGHVSHVRISQIMNLLHLAPDIQERLLHLPPPPRGQRPLSLTRLAPLCKLVDWRAQRRLWGQMAVDISLRDP